MNAADDLVFALTRLFDLPGLCAAAGQPLSAEDIAAILGEAARFAEAELAPRSREADRHGARFENGRITLPPHYATAWRRWVEGGWQGLAAPVAHGGQGLPHSLWAAVLELVTAADMAFTLCPVLGAGAVDLLRHHASPDQAARFLPRLISAEWAATMCLTEPQAGSDLSGLRTRAEPDGAGGWRLTGQKIYITWGEHDLTDNILHLVLARLPDAPPGSRGISLFAAPKRLADGRANAIRCAGIEHKLGIHASPTCVMLFEGAEAELVGEPHRGLPAMFAMMNAARLAVGQQGVAQTVRALSLAAPFAEQREQGGRPIARHADVARMLAEMRAIAWAGRLICLSAYHAMDRADMLGDAAAHRRLALLTPIAKAWCTDRGVEAASLGIQVHGGMGYVEETGAAQILRDARIAPIYEGTNGIQAIDLVMRKVARDEGEAMRALIAEGEAEDPRLAPAARALSAATDWILAAARRDPALAQASAAAYLDAAGWFWGGALLARAARAEPSLAPLAAFYLARLLPRAEARCREVEAGEAVLALA
jgi:alkylation response protein AidB-like acyl-CoA dehydrogenase